MNLQLIAVWLVGLCLACPDIAQAVDGDGALSLRFDSTGTALSASTAGDAWLDVGSLAAETRRGKGIVMHQRIVLHVDGKLQSTPYARVSVALDDEAPGVVVRVDGRVISLVPTLIDPMHRIGRGVVHDIEIAIPADVPPGPFARSLRWTVESD